VSKVGIDSETKQFLMEQYHECAEQYRLHNRQFWQIPSISILLVSAIIGARTALLLIVSNMSLAMCVVLIKLRFFPYAAMLSLEKIENDLAIEKLQWCTERGPAKPRNWFEKQKHTTGSLGSSS